jgi:hypothetical protein
MGRGDAALAWGRRLLLATLVLGVIHHTDHVLRVDHSGWPFLPNVTPFTFSLLVYPLLVPVLLWRTPAWYRVGATALVFLAVQAAHTFLEPPTVQYGTWARGYSVEPWARGTPNLLGLRSPALGVLSATVAVSLGLALLGAAIAFAVAARRARRAV